MSCLQTIDKTVHNGLFNVRNALIDFCSSQEQVSTLIAYLFLKTEEIEKKYKIRNASRYQLIYQKLEDGAEKLRVDILTESKVFLDSVLLHYVDGSLSYLSDEKITESEIIPLSKVGTKINKISSERMIRMLNNTKYYLNQESCMIVDSLIKSLTGITVSFNLSVLKHSVNIQAVNKSNKQLLSLSIPVIYLKPTKPIINHDVENKGYIYEPIAL